jgi:hypothetical protein
MKKIRVIVLVSLSVAGLSSASAQTVDPPRKPLGIASVIKDTAFREEPPPQPPPLPPNSVEMVPVEMKKGAVIDTTAWQEEDEFILPPLPDTSAVPEDELTAAIRKMIVQTGALETGMKQGLANLERMKSEGQNTLPQEFFDRFATEFSSGSFRRIFENYIIRVYRKHLTLEDVNGLIAFYETDLGKKTISVMPQLIGESLEGGAALGQMIGLKIFEQLLEEGKIK